MNAQTIPTSKPGINIPPALSPKLERAALLFFLVHECLNLKTCLVQDLQHHLKLTIAEIERREIRSIPSDAFNVSISTECLKKFGPTRLLASEVFYSFTRSGSVCTCEDWSNTCQCHLETWRLDVQPIYERGLLLPLRDRRGWYSDLLCFRDARDQKPFIVKLRADKEVGA
jgi:hypothetical protein